MDVQMVVSTHFCMYAHMKTYGGIGRTYCKQVTGAITCVTTRQGELQQGVDSQRCTVGLGKSHEPVGHNLTS